MRWEAHRVREFINVLRCYKCLAFGHTMRECRIGERLCQKCGEGEHLAKECRNEENCRNCRMRGREFHHSVVSMECPEYVRAYERERMRVQDG